MRLVMRFGAFAVICAGVMCSTAAAGPINSALRYDGNDFSRVGQSSVFNQIEATDTVTIEAWIQVSGYPQGWFPIIDHHRAATDFGWTFQLFGGGGGFPPTMQFVGGPGPTALVNWAAPLNQWTHVAMSYQRSEGVIRFFANGQLLGAPSYSADIQGTGPNDPLYIGYGPSGGNEFAQGVIDDLRIWNRALSAAEIAANYNRSLSGGESGLVGYWQFDEGSGSTFQDSSASGIHGTLGTGANTPTWVAGAPIATVPEPASVAGLMFGGLAIATYFRRRSASPPAQP